MPAKVYLIGAGPGDPGLLTIKGAECIRRADVVVYDYLANAEFLTYARRDAKLIFVGKKGFSEHVTQEQINDCLIEEALAGHDSAQESSVVVARLKGGDPFVFGRGGEEALALAARGIDFEVVPGVTSGIAAAAYAGIPVTHRKVSSSVAFVTGNEDPTKEETSIDWQGIAHGAQTLCFYMGIRNLPVIAERLMAAGRDSETPVVLVRWGTMPHQEVLEGTLGTIARKAQEANFKAPAIIVVGEVASLRPRIRWVEKRPLGGRVIAVTRARTQASDLVNKLRGLGAEVVECPTIQVEPVSEDAQGVALQAARTLSEGGYDWVVFTSTNGVECFFEYLGVQGLDARAFAGAQVAAIGSATATALAAHGISVDLVPPEYRGESVAASMCGRGVGPNSRVLIARALEARDVLPELLRQRGARVDVVPVYQTVCSTSDATKMAMNRILDGEIGEITFTASSTVRNFFGLLCASLEERGEDCDAAVAKLMGELACYSIGPVTSATLAEYKIKPAAEASVYTIDGLVEAISLHAGSPRCAE